MVKTPYRYFIVNKPYKMVSQFVSSHAVRLLGGLDFTFPEGTHAIGRLDNDSEGLLILTTNKAITRLLFQGVQPHKRVYFVQVKNKVTSERLQQLQNGVSIRIRGNMLYNTGTCEVEILENPSLLVPQAHALPHYIPVTWLRISLTEGKYHQVRKMVSAVQHKCKRLIRVAIEDLVLGDLAPGCVREIAENDFFELLKIEKPPSLL
jgi:23S rRNA pseudouridine2457 synthase